MKNLIVRALSGIVYIGLIVGAILGGWPWFLALTAIFAGLGIVELTKLSHEKPFVPILAVDILFAISPMLACVPMCVSFCDGILNMAFFFSPVLMFMCRIVASLYDKRENPAQAIGHSLMSVLYIGLPLFCLNLLYLIGGEHIALILFIMIWANDTGAYCVGSLLGKHRLCERLSPKKSWEGFWGGMVFSAAIGLGYYFLFRADAEEFGNLAYWVAFGIIVCVFSTWGDLFESMLKRNAHVKDSGNLIPGHGGILDRIDSLLLAAPAALCYLSISAI